MWPQYHSSSVTHSIYISNSLHFPDARVHTVFINNNSVQLRNSQTVVHATYSQPFWLEASTNSLHSDAIEKHLSSLNYGAEKK